MNEDDNGKDDESLMLACACLFRDFIFVALFMYSYCLL